MGQHPLVDMGYLELVNYSPQRSAGIPLARFSGALLNTAGFLFLFYLKHRSQWSETTRSTVPYRDLAPPTHSPERRLPETLFAFCKNLKSSWGNSCSPQTPKIPCLASALTESSRFAQEVQSRSPSRYSFIFQ